jgi:hypothetical protein
MADANKTEYDALIAKLEAHKLSLASATTAAGGISTDNSQFTNSTDKSGFVSKLRSDIAALDKLVKLTPGGASKRRRSGFKKQHKKKGGKSRRQHK